MGIRWDMGTNDAVVGSTLYSGSIHFSQDDAKAIMTRINPAFTIPVVCRFDFFILIDFFIFPDYTTD